MQGQATLGIAAGSSLSVNGIGYRGGGSQQQASLTPEAQQLVQARITGRAEDPSMDTQTASNLLVSWRWWLWRRWNQESLI